MALFNKGTHKIGLMDEIRCDEPSYLIWKWHPVGVQLKEGYRENAIRWGSSLRVKDGEVAVFVYKQQSGTVQDFIEGPFDQILKTANLPVLASIVGLAYKGGTPFQAEVFFINLAKVIQIKFAVPFFDVHDSRFADFGVPVAVRGTISFSIADYRLFIKLHRLSSSTLDDLQAQIHDAVCRYVKDCVANAPAIHDIPVVQIESKTAQINDTIEYDLGKRLSEDFGILISGVDIAAIEVDKASNGYQQLMAITKDVTARKVQAEATDYVERLRLQREEEQYARHKATQTSNMEAFQVEKQVEVGVAGATALGQMTKNGAGSINLGSSSDGFNMAAMMASMAISGAVGQNIAGTMNKMMNSANQSNTMPPPIPTAAYYVAVNGQATGPFDTRMLAQMAISGQLTASSLIWKKGMLQWKQAGAIDELSSLFADIMPPVPSSDE